MQTTSPPLHELRLPWPPPILSPNGRVHWSKVAKAKQSYRATCGWEAIAQGVRAIKAQRLHLTLVFYPPNRRAWDLDNCLASCKALLDGLADVLKVDDKHWSLTISKASETGGFIQVKIHPV